MAINETQLETWSKQGSVTQSKNTYATIKNALTAADTKYADKDYAEPFLQGSYGNDTNVWADSDVDIVMKLDEIFYSDLTRLSPTDQAAYDAVRGGGGVTYGLADFKHDVTAALRKQFGNDVAPARRRYGSSRMAPDEIRTFLYARNFAAITSLRA